MKQRVKIKNICLIIAIILLIILAVVNKKSYAFENNFDNIPDITTLSKSDLNLPSKYDLRDVDGTNYMTPVKNQKNYFLCWAFSSTTSFESVLKKSGYVSNDYNNWYSPFQVDAIISKNYSENVLNYYFDRYNSKYSSHALTKGYFADQALKIFTSGYSPILMSEFDENRFLDYYNNSRKFEENELFNYENNEYYVTDYDQLEPINGISLEEVIKYYVLNYGAVVFSTTSPVSFADENGVCKTIYNSPNSGYHAMVIIGWDDTNKNWIVQNSYGSELPYLYIPYDSYIKDAHGIKNIKKIDFDNRYYTSNEQKLFKKSLTSVEQLNSIVIDVQEKGNYYVYISKDGTFEDVVEYGPFSANHIGGKTIDFSDKNIIFNNEKFGLYVKSDTGVLPNSTYIFTNDLNSGKTVNVYDVEDITDSSQKLHLKFKTKNITNLSQIDFKILNSSDIDVTNKFLLLSDKTKSGKYNNEYYFDIDSSLLHVVDDYNIEVYVDNTLVDKYTFNINYNLSNYFSDGIGTIDDPFVITEASQFDVFKNEPNSLTKAYKLGCDIDLSNYALTNPIGININSSFSGIFDGNNYSLTGLKSIENEEGFYGLFGVIKNGKIINLKLKYFYLSTKNTTSSNYSFYGGVLAGLVFNSDINNIYIEFSSFSNNVNDHNSYIGSVIGVSQGSNISHVYSSSNIISNYPSYSVIGGLFGSSSNSNFFRNVEYAGTIKVDSFPNSIIVGGICGSCIGLSSSQISFNGLFDVSNSELYNKIGYIAGTKDQDLYDIVYSESISNIGIYANDLSGKSNAYGIVSNNRENTDNTIYVNKNSSSYLDEKTYSNLDFEQTWYISDSGPKLQFTRDNLDKTNMIGDSDVYNIDQDNFLITNVKPYLSTLTKEKFTNNFNYFNGTIYQSDGITIVNNSDIIKTGMIVKSGNKTWNIVVSGDINGDGRITATDVIMLRREIAGGYNQNLNNAQLKATDINNDGRMNTTDIVWMRRGIAGGYSDINIWGD